MRAASKISGGEILLTGCFTDKGPVRDMNEDYVKCAVSGDTAFLVIADGLGGAPYGEVASEIACDESINILISDWKRNFSPEERASFLLRLFNRVNGKILRRCIDEPHLSGMCTTLTVVVLTPEFCSIGHVGDSRAYLVKDDELIMISCDHNRAGRLLFEGVITEEEARTHPGRNLLTMVVGENTYLDPHIKELEVRTGDAVVLMTDGVYMSVGEDDILGVRSYGYDLDGYCKNLVSKAIGQGSSDNCTAAAAVICR